MGSVHSPYKSYLMCCEIRTKPVNSSYIYDLINKLLNDYEIRGEKFYILLCDSAPYMLFAGNKLKEDSKKMFHVNCIAHLYHNIVSKISAHYAEVNFLISSIKAALSKNNHRKNMFSEIGIPPNPIIIRWGSWLKAAKYYSKNFQNVKQIVNTFEDDSIIVKNEKEAINNSAVKKQLL